jgi:hypothetical protein
LRSRENLNLFTTAPLYYTFSTQVTSNSWKIIIFVALSEEETYRRGQTVSAWADRIGVSACRPLDAFRQPILSIKFRARANSRRSRSEAPVPPPLLQLLQVPFLMASQRSVCYRPAEFKSVCNLPNRRKVQTTSRLS